MLEYKSLKTLKPLNGNQKAQDKCVLNKGAKYLLLNL